jgi:hypothetical protein
VNAKLHFLGQAEDAFGDHVALDLVGAGVDRAGERELVALHPRSVVAVEQLRLAAEQVERELVQPTSSSDQNTFTMRLRARARPSRCAVTVPERLPAVGLGVDVRGNEPVAQRGSSCRASW